MTESQILLAVLGLALPLIVGIGVALVRLRRDADASAQETKTLASTLAETTRAIADKVFQEHKALEKRVTDLENDGHRQDADMRAITTQLGSISVAIGTISESLGWIKKSLDSLEKHRIDDVMK